MGGTVVVVVVVEDVEVDVEVEVVEDVEDDVDVAVAVDVDVGLVVELVGAVGVLVVGESPSEGLRVAATTARTTAVKSTAPDSTASTDRCQGSSASRNDRIRRGYRSVGSRGTPIRPIRRGGQ